MFTCRGRTGLVRLWPQITSVLPSQSVYVTFRICVIVGFSCTPGSGRRSRGWGDSPDRTVERSGRLDAPACTAAGGLGSAAPPATLPPASAQWNPGGSWTLGRAGERTQKLGVTPSYSPPGCLSHPEWALDTGHTPEGTLG